MHRRNFLRSAIASGALYGTGGLGLLASSRAQAQFGFPPRPVVVNVTLLGGPDFRHLLPPAWSGNGSTYGNRFWRARARSFGVGDSATELRRHWETNYVPKTSQGVNFGILKSSTWLNTMWDAGNVAVVNNVVGSTSRDHEHAILVMDQGDRQTGPNDHNRSGWGGRLAQVGNTNVMALTFNPRPFCYGRHSSGDETKIDTTRIIGAADTRNMGLYEARANQDPRYDNRGMMARALKSYYSGLDRDLPADSIHREFVDQEKRLRRFGRAVENRLNQVTEPAAFRALYDLDNSPMANPWFGLQTRNLFDTLACSDILNIGVASMEYDGWDTHAVQASRIEENLTDLFGTGRSFDLLWRSLPANIKSRVVFCFQGEFGRQLRANGEGGTDHGKGTSVLLVGQPVNGGLYGDMFPGNEISRMDGVSADINGLTAIDHVYGALCDWSVPGSGGQVFPGRGGSQREGALNPSQLLG